ncbi:MAG: Hpt domain-containing protein [Candidatus Omnitrophota bacterium]
MSEDIIDLKEVMERVENDQELLIELIEIFLEDYPGRMKSLKEAATQNDFSLIKDVAHSLKGASANISAKKISSLFLDVEHMAQKNDLSAMGDIYSKLEGLIEDLKRYLSTLKK